MTTQSPMTSKRALHIYSVEVEQWWDGAGDTDQMLSAREWLEGRFEQLGADDLARLRALDAQVMKLAAQFPVAGSWDVSMLKQTAVIAARHCVSA